MSDATSDLAAGLRSRWSDRFPGVLAVGGLVIDRYADPTRVYHDLRHLDDVLGHVDVLAGETRDPTVVELAAWFHDAVYDVRRDDNEQASAELARRLLTPHLPPIQVGEVVRLVLLTRDHAVAPGDPNGAVLCDADLAVLGGSPEDYGDYAARVRTEYAQVPDDLFREGRAVVLRQLLALPRLFHTSHGRAHWESPARANLAAELEALAPGT